MHDVAGVDNIISLALRQSLGLSFWCARRKTLQAPFLIRDALEACIAVMDDLPLPTLVTLLPFGPSSRCEVGDTIRDARGFGCDLLYRLLAVDEGLTSRQWEEEDAHLEWSRVRTSW